MGGAICPHVVSRVGRCRGEEGQPDDERVCGRFRVGAENGEEKELEDPERRRETVGGSEEEVLGKACVSLRQKESLSLHPKAVRGLLLVEQQPPQEV